jgi:hypothetical protein
VASLLVMYCRNFHMAPFSLGAGHRIFVSIANYQTLGRIPFGEYVSGIWASLFAGETAS